MKAGLLSPEDLRREDNWEYHARDRAYSTAFGFGEYRVQHAPKVKRWYLMTVPFLGTPTVLSDHNTKWDAFKAAEETRKRLKGGDW